MQQLYIKYNNYVCIYNENTKMGFRRKYVDLYPLHISLSANK